MWIGALLWLWCAAAGRPVVRATAERVVGANPELHVRTALIPLRVEGLERLASPKPRGRWTPTTAATAATVVAVLFVRVSRRRLASEHAQAPRPRRLAFSYDATAPPTAL